tara:strand:+ start:441 stop:698 length:258 start_codon:yes stop_codon:yes gene_type:complete
MTEWKLVEGMNYCKGGLKDNKPIVITDFISNETVMTNKWVFVGYDLKGKRVKLECEFVNQDTEHKGKKNKSGARVKMLKYEEELI